ncbi:hypothetical protein [Halalkalirubrum salinum]|uniref:hypothetical protein n=1 Tax=Halalkalirubrum salinum TaxID=2563889 RepID=UPI0010FB01F9|nr:hypothetical protein [Halalkalirubrum salinum]
MIYRRTYLTSIGAVGIALPGCLSADNASDSHPSIADQFDGEPNRPECDRDPETIEIEQGGESRTVETVGTIPYPDPPSTVTDDSAVEYVTDFEGAYVHHRSICESSDYILRVEYSVQETTVIDRAGPISIVMLLVIGGASEGVSDDGSHWVADMGTDGVVYAVDETGAARVEYREAAQYEERERRDQMPDPLTEGTVVAVFE